MKFLIVSVIFLLSKPLYAEEFNLLSHIDNQPVLLFKENTNLTVKSSLFADFNTALLKSNTIFLGLQLPNGQNISIQKSHIKNKTENKFSWFGHIVGETESKVNFAVVNKHISGSVFLNKEVFELVPLGNNKVQIKQLNTQNFEECDGAIKPQINHAAANTIENTKGLETTLDILIVYSNDTLTALGSHAAIEATAQASINNMNTALSNSMLVAGVDEVRLVTVLAIDRDESGSSATELSWLRADANVSYLRNLYGVDLVSMLTTTTGCGRGYVMTFPSSSFSSWAFQITRHNCAVGNLSMAHEFGHNLGLEHNPEDSGNWPDNGSYPYSFAHYHDGEFRTVMSYSAPCTLGCNRKMYYSNPDVTYTGLATGVADSKDNVRSLEQTTLIAVDFRQFVEDLIYTNGFE